MKRDDRPPVIIEEQENPAFRASFQMEKHVSKALNCEAANDATMELW